MKYIPKPFTVLAGEFILFALIVTGAVPRPVALVLAVALMLHAAVADLPDVLVVFVASLPFFLALPITSSYDNLNTWRLVSLVIFARWILEGDALGTIVRGVGEFLKAPLVFSREHRVLMLLLVLLGLAVLSLSSAQYLLPGIKRVIYFINIALVGIVLYITARSDLSLIRRLVRTVAVPTVAVALVGFVQLASTYFVDIYRFLEVWGEGVQLRQFGAVWSMIAVELGNTWFAYFGDQLSLRVFSLFPDSHSFPLFVLLGMPALFALAFAPFVPKVSPQPTFRKLVTTRTGLAILWIPALFLIAILSGTRGIWAASIGVVFWALGVWLFLRRRNAGALHRNLFLHLSSYLVIFFLLFSVAYPIFASPQFLLSKGDSFLLKARLRSILDFAETSNAQRIAIWTASVRSIVRHPFLGVGIGNFPVVLGQDIFLAKAGSSAHNLYLQIAAEMGLLALAAALWFLWQAIRTIWRNYLASSDGTLLGYFGALLLMFPWVLLYSLTDVAILDERTLLLTTVTLAIVFARAETAPSHGT